MKLIQLGKKTWTVLAAVDHRDDCQVLDHLLSLTSSVPAVKRMLYRLRHGVPETGPELQNDQKAKHLRDEIYELKEQPKKGPKPRVFFFYDGNIIVCTEAIEKRDDDLTVNITRALDTKRQYFESKQNGTIVIEELE